MAKWPYCHPWPTVRKRVLERDNYECQIRGTKCTHLATQVDHVVPPSEAPHLWIDESNLRAACSTCNSGRSQARLAAMAHLNRQRTPEPSRDWLGSS